MGWISKILKGSQQSKTVDDIFDKDQGLLAKAGAWGSSGGVQTADSGALRADSGSR